jgi:hypothetical protein
MQKAGFALLLAVLALFAVPASAGGRPIPMIEVIDAPVTWPGGQPGELSVVQNAVLRGLADKGWTGRMVSPGVARATLTRDDWSCEIEIPFTTSAYSIKYADSVNLDYNPQTRVIHRNFNHWLVLLRQRIDLQMMQAVP